MSVWRAQQEIDSAEFAEWMARDDLPGIQSAADLRAGRVMAVIAEVNRDTKRRREPFVPADFFPRAPELPRVRTNEELMAMALAFQARMNAQLPAA
jgi:hypothetical protein